MEKSSLSIIGLGKLGSPMLAAYASKGYKVIGVDVNPDFVKAIDEGKPPVFEPKLGEYLTANHQIISATQDYREAILNSDITFIVVPTPSEPDGNFSTKYAVEVVKNIGKVLKEKPNFHLVVLTSTITPGSTERDLLSVLEEYSGKKCGSDFGFCYNPEFIALGDVIDDLLNPDFVLIGESDSRSGDILETFYKNICQNNPPIKRMSIINAEITKIALNTYVTTKISYANMLAELCEKIPGGNVDVVTDALGCDKRIGSLYLKGALGYGGPCFPRDNRALIHTAKKHNVSLPIIEATDLINKKQVPRIIKIILSQSEAKRKVSILGLSYKINTDVIDESQSVEIAKILSERGFPVMVYDPAAMENTKKLLKDQVDYASSLKECLQWGNIIIIATPWPEFRDIEPNYLKREDDKVVLVDCWRIINPKRYEGIIKYLPIGINYL